MWIYRCQQDIGSLLNRIKSLSPERLFSISIGKFFRLENFLGRANQACLRLPSVVAFFWTLRKKWRSWECGQYRCGCGCCLEWCSMCPFCWWDVISCERWFRIVKKLPPSVLLQDPGVTSQSAIGRWWCTIFVNVWYAKDFLQDGMQKYWPRIGQHTFFWRGSCVAIIYLAKMWSRMPL